MSDLERHPDDLPPPDLPRLGRRLPRGIGWAAALALVTFGLAAWAIGGGPGEGDTSAPAASPGTSSDLPPPANPDEVEGAPLPTVAWSSFEGETVEPGALGVGDGRPAVLNYWASWCTPCLAEMPAFEQVHQELGDQALIIGVNVRDAPSPAARTAERTGVTYPLVRDPEGTTLLALGGVSMPTTVLVAGDGTVAEVISRPLDAAELRTKIEGLAG